MQNKCPPLQEVFFLNFCRGGTYSAPTQKIFFLEKRQKSCSGHETNNLKILKKIFRKKFFSFFCRGHLKDSPVFFWIYVKSPPSDFFKNKDISAIFCRTARFLIFLETRVLAGSGFGHNMPGRFGRNPQISDF